MNVGRLVKFTKQTFFFFLKTELQS